MPKMSSRIAKSDALIQIPNVVGDVDIESVARQVESKCDVRLYSEVEDKAWETTDKDFPISVPKLPFDLRRTGSVEEKARVLKQTGTLG